MMPSNASTTRIPALARPVAVALLALATAACGGGDEAADTRGAWKEGEAWRLVPEASIGSIDGPQAFGRVVDVAVDPLGRVWVADGQQQQIQVFAPEGAHVRTIGKKGGGPEEFTGLGGMDWGPDGHLWVMDAGSLRFSVWDTAGALVATHPRRANATVVPWPLGFDAQGRLYDYDAPGVPGDERTFVVRLGPDRQPRDTFVIPAFEDPVFELVRRDGGNTSINAVNVPFSGRQVWRVDSEGFVWVAVTDRYRLERLAFDGSVERAVERRIAPRPVTREERSRALQAYAGFQKQGGKIDESRIPDTHPAFEDFFFGDEGTLWVRLATGRTEPLRLDVFDARGTYLGQVTAPTRLMTTPAPIVRGGRMVGVVQDEDGMHSVVVLRLEKPGS